MKRIAGPLLVAIVLSALLVVPEQVDAQTTTSCLGKPVTINMNTGASGIGTNGADVILGTNGNDVIDGLGGNDLICGLAGDDLVTGGDGNDTIDGGSGHDLIRGNPGADRIDGGSGDDRVFGGIGDDHLSGGDGDDYLGGFGGADSIDGGDGNETIFGGYGADFIDGGPGNDTIRGLIGNDTINGGPGNDKLHGDRGNDTIDGGSGNDTVQGGSGNDNLDGGNGSDNLSGGKADDNLSGGNSVDTCNGNLEHIADTADGTCETTSGIETSTAPGSTPNPTATSAPNPTATSAPNPTATTAPNPTATTAPNPTATPTPDPTTTPSGPGDCGANTSGQADLTNDLISLHYDHAPDRDDGHATAAGKEVSISLGFTPWVIGGAYGDGNQHTYNSDSEAVMDAVWGPSGWVDAHADWNSAVLLSADRWQLTLEGCGDIWVAEGGQSDVTADIIRKLKVRLPGLDTNARIHVVQHSQWNQGMSNDADLAYVRDNTDYNKITDGNSEGNGTAGFNERTYSGPFNNDARNGRNGAGWTAAFEYYSPENLYLDFSDTVELMEIVGIGTDEVSDVEDFADRFIRSDIG